MFINRKSTAQLQAKDRSTAGKGPLNCRQRAAQLQAKGQSTAGHYGPLHIHFMVQVMLIIKGPTVTVKCRWLIKAIFLHYFNLYFVLKCNVG